MVENHQDEKALSLLQQAEGLKGELLDKVYNLEATIYSEAKDFDKAEYYFKKAIAIKPKTPGYYRNLGTLYFDHKLFQKALHPYQTTLDLDPNDLKMYITIALSYKNLRNETAGLKWFKKFLQRCGMNCGELLKQWNSIPSASSNGIL